MAAQVKIYSLSTCGYCNATKRFLQEKDVAFDFIDVDLLPKEKQNEVLEEVKRYNPRLSFPTIIIGEEIIIGFEEQKIRKALNL